MGVLFFEILDICDYKRHQGWAFRVKSIYVYMCFTLGSNRSLGTIQSIFKFTLVIWISREMIIAANGRLVDLTSLHGTTNPHISSDYTFF